MYRLVVICILIFSFGCSNGNTVNENEENTNVDANGSDRTDSEFDILDNPQYPSVAVFLYNTRSEINNHLLSSSNIHDQVNYLEFIINTKKHAKHFSALEDNLEVGKLLDEFVVKVETLQLERDLDKRKGGLKELNQLIGQLIGLTDENGQYIGSRIIHFYHLEELVIWLESIKASIRDEEFEYIDSNYEIFLAASIPSYVSEYARLEVYSNVKENLNDLKEMAELISDEHDKRKRIDLMIKLEAIVDSILDNPEVHINWSKTVDPDEDVDINKLRCNDVTGKVIPTHLVDICHFYDQLDPLTNDQREVLYKGTGDLAVRDVFNRDIPMGQDGFAVGLEDYGPYLLLSYLSWRAELKPNAKGEFKSLKGTKDFEEFFMLTDDEVEVFYEPFSQGANAKSSTLLDAIEYEIIVVSRMKHLKLAESFYKWADETIDPFVEARQFFNEGNFDDSYMKYSEGLKRIHDLYFTIPAHSIMDGWNPY